MRRLDRNTVLRLAKELGFGALDDADEYVETANELIGSLARIDALPAGLRIPRASTRRETAPEADPFNAVIRWCSVADESGGPLRGVRVGVKDSIPVAGIPMTLGSRFMAGYVPAEDAIVVDRLLAAGAEIRAICNMDEFAVSATGQSSPYGPVRNPYDPNRRAGGSSGGCAAALYLSAIDVTFGADQGGSVRVPAAWCGVLGLKPTFGLIPYSGAVGLDSALDHIGIMARQTEMLGRALAATASLSPHDRERVLGAASSHRGATDRFSLRIGILKEAVDSGQGLDARVRDVTLDAAQRFTDLGAVLTTVSVPAHLLAPTLQLNLYLSGVYALHRASGTGTGWIGHYATEFAAEYHARSISRAAEIGPAMRTVLLAGAFVTEQIGTAYYGRAHNLRQSVIDAYDAVFDEVDVLLMPTIGVTAPELSMAGSLYERVFGVSRGRQFGPNNTSPFNLTGHPALTLPVATIDGMPTGLQLVARRNADADLLRSAGAYEAAYGWVAPTTANP